jgi:MFS family permease
LGSFSYGYCASIIASTLGQPRFLQYFGLEGNGSGSNGLLGATNGLFQTGGFFGALLIGPAADKLSRKGAIVLACVLLVIGGSLQAGSVHVAMFLVMRFIAGMGVGLCVGCVPLYQSEVSPSKSRGFLVGLHGKIYTPNGAN